MRSDTGAILMFPELSVLVVRLVARIYPKTHTTLGHTKLWELLLEVGQRI